MDIGKKKSDISLPKGMTLEQKIRTLEIEMDIAATSLDFEKAAEIRDEILLLSGHKAKK